MPKREKTIVSLTPEMDANVGDLCEGIVDGVAATSAAVHIAISCRGEMSSS